jgi:hypothetical protein
MTSAVSKSELDEKIVGSVPLHSRRIDVSIMRHDDGGESVVVRSTRAADGRCSYVILPFGSLREVISLLELAERARK